MDRIKRTKGIITVATAVFMLLTFVVPDVGMIGTTEVKAEAAAYVTDTDDMMNIDTVFSSENTSNEYFTVTNDTVTITKGAYKIENINSGTDTVKGYKLTKNLIMNGGTLTVKQPSESENPDVRILTNGKSFSINDGEVFAEDNAVDGVTAANEAVLITGSGASEKSVFMYSAATNGTKSRAVVSAKQLAAGSSEATFVRTDKVRVTKGKLILPSATGLYWYTSDDTIASGAMEYKALPALSDEARLAANTYTLKAANPVQIVSTAALEVNKTVNLKVNITGRPTECTESYRISTALDGCSVSNSGTTAGVFTAGPTAGSCSVEVTIGPSSEYGPKVVNISITVTEHTHKGMTRTAGKAASCTEAGSETYYTCSDCGKKYTDAKGTTEITETVIPALGHALTATAAKEPTCLAEGNAAYWSCSRCGKLFLNDKGEQQTTLAATKRAKLNHVLVFHGAKDAGCTENGNKAYWKCENCSSCFSDKDGTKPTTEEAVLIAKTGHRMTAHEEYKATCEKDGQKAYWTCALCKKTYVDASGTKELTSASDLVIKATGHTIVEVPKKEPTCDADGRKAHYKCSACNKVFSDIAGTKETTEVAMTEKARGHKLVLHAAKVVDCSTDGNKTYWSCSVCSRVFLDIDGINETTLEDVIIKCEGHKMTEHEEIKGDCLTDGKRAYWDCSVCGKYYADSKGTEEITAADIDIPAPGHMPVHVPAVTPTKTAPGNTEYWKCSVCGACFADKAMKTEIAEESTEIPAAEHILKAHEEIPADCEKDGRLAYWECTDCGKIFADADAKTETTLEELLIPAEGHVWGPWVITKLATKTDPGIKARTCLRNPLHIQTIGVPPTGEDEPDTPVVPPDRKAGISYRAYVQKTGWQSYVRDGAVAGTKGKSLRLEALRIKLHDADGGIKYRVYVGKDGWQSVKSDGAVAGTTGKSKRLETIQVSLTGNAAVDYNVFYRVYTQRLGWLGWAKNGGSAGTRGYDYRIEAIQMKLQDRSAAAPSGASKAYLRRS